MSIFLNVARNKSKDLCYNNRYEKIDDDLFEYLKIPQTATIIFKDKTIVGGVAAWIKEENLK